MKSSDDLTVREAAQRLEIDLNYAYTLIWSGKLKGEKKNGRWVVSAASVRAREQLRKENNNGWQHTHMGKSESNHRRGTSPAPNAKQKASKRSISTRRRSALIAHEPTA
jgi:Helix-turn-helix domain